MLPSLLGLPVQQGIQANNELIRVQGQGVTGAHGRGIWGVWEGSREDCHLWEVYGGITQDLQAGSKLGTGTRYWNRATPPECGRQVLSQNTAEYSSLTCDQMTNVPAGHERSLIHFPQWAVLTLFSMWVMTCKGLGITAYKELRKRCFCCSARLCSHSLLPQSSLLFFSTPQSSCRT